jgi:phosphopantetheinyl transferase
MPLVYQQNINAFTKIGLWHITEPEDFFLDLLPLPPIRMTPQKRLQHLAGRILLPALYGDFPLHQILIADSKKPYLAGNGYHFSISHTGQYAAAIVSTKHKVGVDIEMPHQKVERIQHKFLTTYELRLLAKLGVNSFHWLTMAWSVKETLYKWHGDGNVDFKAHLRIARVGQFADGVEVSCAFLRDEPVHVSVRAVFQEGLWLTWLV